MEEPFIAEPVRHDRLAPSVASSTYGYGQSFVRLPSTGEKAQNTPYSWLQALYDGSTSWPMIEVRIPEKALVLRILLFVNSDSAVNFRICSRKGALKVAKQFL